MPIEAAALGLEEAAVGNPFGGAPVYRGEVLDSTMTAARRLSRAGAPDGTVVTARFQTAGRGRVTGRRWEAERGSSLLMTLFLKSDSPYHGLRTPSEWGRLPLVAGLGVCRCLESLGVVPRLKWPNDILIGGSQVAASKVAASKVAGILCEAGGGGFFVGIGVNCLQHDFEPALRRQAGGPADPLPAGSALPAVSLRQCLGQAPAPDLLLAPLLSQLKRSLGDAAWREECESRLYRRGDFVLVEEGLAGSGSRRRVRLSGIGAAGELLALRSGGPDQPEGFLALHAGEILWDG